MKYLIISLLKSKLLHQHLFTFSQKVTFSLNVNTVFLQLFFKTGSPVSFSVKIPYNIVDNKGGGAHAQ